MMLDRLVRLPFLQLQMRPQKWQPNWLIGANIFCSFGSWNSFMQMYIALLCYCKSCIHRISNAMVTSLNYKVHLQYLPISCIVGGQSAIYGGYFSPTKSTMTMITHLYFSSWDGMNNKTICNSNEMRMMLWTLPLLRKLLMCVLYT
jgi:hypothetical protein